MNGGICRWMEQVNGIGERVDSIGGGGGGWIDR